MKALPIVFVATLLNAQPGMADGGVVSRLLAPAPLILLDEPETLPAGCAFRSSERGALLGCPSPVTVELTVAMEGYEARSVTFVAGEAEVDLRDERWRPRPTRLVLAPPDLAVGAVAVWVEDGELRVAEPAGGYLLGPRVRPGEKVVLAVVGPHTSAVVVSEPRVPSREPLAVRLRPGRSAAVACREPWTGEVASACEVQLGTVTDLLDQLGGSRLMPRGSVTSLGPLRLLEIPRAAAEGLPLRILAATGDGASALAELAGAQAVYEIDLEPPLSLRVTVEERGAARTLTGAVVRVSRSVDAGWLVVAEERTDAGGVAELALAPGEYRVVADAPGHAPAQDELRLTDRDREVTLSLDVARTVAGVVVDPEGSPLPGTVVMAVTSTFGFDSRNNLARADGSGRFEVTLPGRGPWTLLAQREGYLAEPLTVNAGAEWVTLVLYPRCEVVLWPLHADGSPVEVARLALLRVGLPQVVIAERRARDGGFRAALAPGMWTVVVEEEGLSGFLDVPEACTGFQTPVFLKSSAGEDHLQRR